jgi:ABC-type uncharacterized transport system permease subunit
MTQAPGVILLQVGWTALLILAGMMLWRRNQERLIIQGG